MNEKKKKILLILFLCVFFVMSLLPLTGYVFSLDGENKENRTLAKCPPLVKDGGLNTDFDEEFETFFSENFGFRQQLITLWSAPSYFLFGQSEVEKVTVGKDRWLFLTETIDDFEGTNLYSDRMVYRLAETVRLMDRYAASENRRFVFLSAPDKATVYPEMLPSSVRKGETSNLERLTDELKNDSFFVDAKGVIESERRESGKQLYYKYDSHWNNTGAEAVYRAVQEKAGVSECSYTDYVSFTDYEPDVHSGDLGVMLLPKYSLTEDDVKAKKEYRSKRPITDLMTFKIETENKKAFSSVYMFRDSFGNAFVNIFSNNYRRAFYDRSMPYDMTKAVKGEYEVIVLEKVERELQGIIENAPIAYAVSCGVGSVSDCDAVITAKTEESDSDMVVTGKIDDSIPLGDRDNIYIEIADKKGTTYYEAFPTAKGDAFEDRCFTARFKAETLPENAEIRICIGDAERVRAYCTAKTE